MSTKFIVGLDEAGRGAVAGPIVAAAVLSQGFDYETEVLSQVKDSKKLTPKKREQLFKLIDDNFYWSVDVIDNLAIDNLGIQAMNCLVIEKALEKVLQKVEVKNLVIVSDFVGAAHKYIKTKNISFYKNGETIFPEIAAASIMAKVYRDNLMCVLAGEYEQYDFAQHKGYGTRYHLDCVHKHGLCPIHRQTFLHKYLK